MLTLKLPGHSSTPFIRDGRLCFLATMTQRTRVSCVHVLIEVKRAGGEEMKKIISQKLCQNPCPLPLKKNLSTLPSPLSRSPRRLTRIRVLRLGIRALAAMDGGGGGGAEGELTAQETALYDRQIRVWGVDAQKRCAALKNSTFAIVIISLLFSIQLSFFLYFTFFFKHALVILFAKKSIFVGFMIYFGFIAKFRCAFSSWFWPKACIFMWKKCNCCRFTCLREPSPNFCCLPKSLSWCITSFWANCYICVSWNRLSKAHVLVCGMNGTTIEVTDFAVELLVW